MYATRPVSGAHKATTATARLSGATGSCLKEDFSSTIQAPSLPLYELASVLIVEITRSAVGTCSFSVMYQKEIAQLPVPLPSSTGRTLSDCKTGSGALLSKTGSPPVPLQKRDRRHTPRQRLQATFPRSRADKWGPSARKTSPASGRLAAVFPPHDTVALWIEQLSWHRPRSWPLMALLNWAAQPETIDEGFP